VSSAHVRRVVRAITPFAAARPPESRERWSQRHHRRVRSSRHNAERSHIVPTRAASARSARRAACPSRWRHRNRRAVRRQIGIEGRWAIERHPDFRVRRRRPWPVQTDVYETCSHETTRTASRSAGMAHSAYSVLPAPSCSNANASERRQDPAPRRHRRVRSPPLTWSSTCDATRPQPSRRIAGGKAQQAVDDGPLEQESPVDTAKEPVALTLRQRIGDLALRRSRARSSSSDA
jgi:hypothetical protein